MKVIGAGLGRTGTYSLKLALERLGFGPCYHMETVLQDPERRISHWNAVLAGNPNWERIFDGFQSVVDWPAATFYIPLRDAYPEVDVPLAMIRDFKESYSYVGESESGARVKVPVEGKPRKIEIGKQLGLSCNQLLDEVFDVGGVSYRLERLEGVDQATVRPDTGHPYTLKVDLAESVCRLQSLAGDTECLFNTENRVALLETEAAKFRHKMRRAIARRIMEHFQLTGPAAAQEDQRLGLVDVSGGCSSGGLEERAERAPSFNFRPGFGF